MSNQTCVCPVCDAPLDLPPRLTDRMNVFCPECGATLEVEQRDPIQLRAVHEHEEVAQTLAAVWRDWR